jgi:hypothetical protein
MLSDAMRSVARNAGLAVVPYENDLGFTVIRENDDLYFVFVLNSGEWQVHRASDATMMASGSGAASFLMALKQYFDRSDAMPMSAA